MTSLLTRSRIEWLNLDGKVGYSINPWVGCRHNCQYCWARDLRKMTREEWHRPTMKFDFIRKDLALAVSAKVKPGMNILLSATTDFFQPDLTLSPVEGVQVGIQEEILRGLSWEKEAQVWVLTKSNAFLKFLPLLERAKVGVSISSLGPIGPEVFAPIPIPRHLALGEAKKAGCSTYISIEPWIPGVTRPREIIEMSESYCDWWIIGSLNRMMRAVDPDFYRRELPPLLDWIRAQGLEKRVYIKKELRRLCQP